MNAQITPTSSVWYYRQYIVHHLSKESNGKGHIYCINFFRSLGLTTTTDHFDDMITVLIPWEVCISLHGCMCMCIHTRNLKNGVTSFVSDQMDC